MNEEMIAGATAYSNALGLSALRRAHILVYMYSVKSEIKNLHPDWVKWEGTERLIHNIAKGSPFLRRWLAGVQNQTYNPSGLVYLRLRGWADSASHLTNAEIRREIKKNANQVRYNLADRETPANTLALADARINIKTLKGRCRDYSTKRAADYAIVRIRDAARDAHIFHRVIITQPERVKGRWSFQVELSL